MTCAVTGHPTREEALTARRRIRRAYRLPSTVHFCESCGAYHALADNSSQTFNPYLIKVLEYLAQGYRTNEIANFTGTSARTVRHTIDRMALHLNALSRAHLVAIALSIGLVNPHIIPVAEQRMHA